MSVLEILPPETTLSEALERVEELVISGHEGAALDIQNYAIIEE